MDKRDQVIVALDMSLVEACSLVEELDDAISIYKVGLELFLRSGPEVLSFLYAQKKKVFLDLKFYDIPNTVEQATIQALAYPNILFFTMHALGGSSMLQAGIQASKKTNALPIAVTILTSFSEEEWSSMIPEMPLHKGALHLAQYSFNAGVAGVVCSPLEAKDIKNTVSKNCITICPGIRPLDVDHGDQKRTMTPSEAIENCADYLVIGRPITKASDPKSVALSLFESKTI